MDYFDVDKFVDRYDEYDNLAFEYDVETRSELNKAYEDNRNVHKRKGENNSQDRSGITEGM